ncbi:MAG TPA: hypothetical protein VF682_05745 [Pseudomonas sp.]|jgi:hypothetical protein
MITNQLPFHASAPVAESAMVLSYRLGINAIELSQMADAIYKLALYPSTFVTHGHVGNLRKLEALGYVEVSVEGKLLQVRRTCAPGLLLNYFWSVWIPDYFASHHNQVIEQANACGGMQQHFMTVVYRLKGDRHATQALLELAENIAETSHADIVHVRSGNALQIWRKHP